ncbi:TonB-dependent siderophore receptor [Herminiimonas sp. CN]|uniref:TonB-dependent receptor plug domain-containing protein n=1 Tax=Herminiimonas sp. CN TaxID=1349818 RepID=UPI0004738183|nr:TonB-dependent receptor [Herminiimonas sp. CN]
MLFTKKPAAAAVALALSSLWQTAIAQSKPATETPPAQLMTEVVINASKVKDVEPNNANLDAASLAPIRASTSDTAALLKDVPGISLYGAGGVSSLPAIHGLADDRLRIKVDGMDLISACANHMNSPLSYIDPTNVGSIKVFAGITPVSVGGDSIGGTIQVNSAEPEFANPGQGTVLKGQAGTFYRSNGNATGINLAATVASENLSVNYTGSTTEAGNYTAAKNFKPAAQSTGTRSFLAGDAVGSSSYKSENQAIAVALRGANNLLELKLGLQHIPYQGFPNQRMDMTGNESEQINLRYAGQYQWGTLEARVYNENTRHKMNFLEDKLTIGSKGMPMDTKGKTTGALLKADIALSARDTLKVGSEYQRQRLDDWWDPVSATPGMMAPNRFWNINDGRRDRFDVFGEWEARWNTQWQSQLGVRSSSMTMNTGNVQGYNNMGGMMGYGDPSNPASIPGAFNAADRKKTGNNIDVTALARYTPDAGSTFEAGFARKTRSPNLYERFAWSTNNAMVMNMVNWFGDGNGYVGNLDLKPEVANTISATANWHDAAQESWGLSITPYYTHVDNYIDAARCPVAAGTPCSAANRDAKTGFVYLQFVNQSARLYGVDVSGYMPLARSSDFGAFTATGMLNYVNGKNNTTGDNLYNIMPLNAKLAVVQRIGNWTNTIEGQFVDAKTSVSQVRNELKTGGYSLLNLRSSYEWKQVRLDIGVENALNKLYASPLGGAYVGQRPMTYGTSVPGMGRSIYTALNVKF